MTDDQEATRKIKEAANKATSTREQKAEYERPKVLNEYNTYLNI